jgi:hypothetical protein
MVSDVIIRYCGIYGPIAVKELKRIVTEKHLESFVVGLLNTGTYADLIETGMCCDAVNIH